MLHLTLKCSKEEYIVLKDGKEIFRIEKKQCAGIYMNENVINVVLLRDGKLVKATLDQMGVLKDFEDCETH